MSRIFLVGTSYMNYTDALCKALTQLGHDVQFYKLDFFRRKELDGWNCIKAYMNKERTKTEFYRIRVNKFKEVIRNSDFDIFIYFNGLIHFDYMNEDISNLIKAKGAKSIVWYMDSIRNCKDTNKTLAYYDEIYSFEKTDVEYYREQGVEVKFLPIGVDESIYCTRSLDGTNNKKLYDLCFVGGATPNRLIALEQIAKYAFENGKTMIVYGDYWYNKYKLKECWQRYKFKNKYPHLYRYVNNKNLTPNKVAELYSNCRICLNIHTSIHNGCNPRTFEILGNGNFELCDFREEFQWLGINNGEHLAIYNNSEECITKIDYYLKHEEECNVIGKKGMKVVSDNFTIKELINKGMNL